VTSNLLILAPMNVLFPGVGGFLLHGPKCVAGNDYRKRGRSFGHRTEIHDVKELHGAGEQQVRNVWCNVACWNLCLWLHTMVELWSWRRSGTTLKQRDDRPRDDPTHRPNHADRLKTLKKHTLCETFSALPRRQRAARKIQRLFQALARLVN